MTHRLEVFAACCIVFAIATPLLPYTDHTQTASQGAFAFAALAPVKPGEHFGDIGTDGQRLVGTSVSLKFMIERAYNVSYRQVIGGPSWLGTECFDLLAKADRPAPKQDLDRMFQTLLTERFHLKVHRESRELPVYVLTIAKSRTKLHESAPAEATNPLHVTGRGPTGRKLVLEGTAVHVSDFADYLARYLRRPVLDRTGLDQAYDIKFKWDPSYASGQDAIQTGFSLPGGPYLFEALRHELGLRLDGKKAPVEVLVVDHAERPTT